MKHKVKIAIALSAMLTISALSSSLASEIHEADLPPLENAVTTDSSGTAVIPTDSLIDFIFPSSIQDTAVTAIAAGAFQGCDLFRTVTIPPCITEIGSEAFAGCLHLEQIILEGRTDTSGMTLGNNWSGSAEVLFQYIADAPPSDSEPLSDTIPDADSDLSSESAGPSEPTADSITPPAAEGEGTPIEPEIN